MASGNSAVRLADGAFDASYGVDSSRVTTVQSQTTPQGLPRNALAWLTNGTVRGGGIEPRSGWLQLVKVLNEALFQGAYLYEPLFANPYIIAQIAGRIYKIQVEAPYQILDLSAFSGLTNPPDVRQVFMAQGEEFLVIQAGDTDRPTPTLPLFWDGISLTRSHGITGNTSGPNVDQIPAATCMVYYAGRLWYAQGRQYTAGDIVGGPSGTNAHRTNSILNVTENPLAIGGDGFQVPAQSGNITALFYTANLDSTLGQGPLYISTRKNIYSLVVPVSRTDWIASNNNNQPVQTVAQFKYGTVGDRCVTHVNGDVFYQSLEPSIRSLFVSVKYFQQWGNVQISNNENRVLAFNNRGLMRTATGIEFDNRMLQAILPVDTPCGVAFQGIAPLDFDLVSTLQEKRPPAWEGMLEGLDILQLLEGDFGGRQRAFAIIRSRPDQGGDGGIWIWELTDFAKVDKTEPDGNRVNWYFETPAWTFEEEFQLKRLDGGEIWVDKVSGTLEMVVDYRQDEDPCWKEWFRTEFCAAKSSCESVANPVCYPIDTFCGGYKFPITLPKPPVPSCAPMNKRPSDIGYQFQVRVSIKGFCRVRGLLFFALPWDRKPFEGLTC